MARLSDQLIGHQKQRQQFALARAQSRVPRTWLLVGPSGIGKKLFAQMVAQELLCEKNQSQACGDCGSCRRVASGQHESVLTIAPEGQQIKIDQAREVIQFTSLRSWGRYQIVIIDEVQKLNPQAANSLLKTLEEPPEGCYFILLTPSVSGVLPTIRSRAQAWFFSGLEPSELKQISSAPEWILEASQGRVELLELLQSKEVEAIRSPALESLEKILQGGASEALEVLGDLVKDREQALLIARLWQQGLRDLALMKNGLEGSIHKDWALKAQPGLDSVDAFYELYLKAFQLENDIHSNIERSLIFENYVYQARELLAVN